MLFHPNDYKNTSDALDLYAQIEDMTEVKEAASHLYVKYLEELQNIEFDSLLDVGCGSGDFLSALSTVMPNIRFKGIDLSPIMVEKARNNGVDAEVIDLCDIQESYDVITAIFDTLNYIMPIELNRFLECVENHLNDGGYFLCDINTLYGFEEIANGSLIVDEEDKFLAIDSEFDNNIYEAIFTLFIQDSDNRYKKIQKKIHQFYHTIESIDNSSNTLEIVDTKEIALYSDTPDKILLVMKKSESVSN